MNELTFNTKKPGIFSSFMSFIVNQDLYIKRGIMKNAIKLGDLNAINDIIKSGYTIDDNFHKMIEKMVLNNKSTYDFIKLLDISINDNESFLSNKIISNIIVKAFRNPELGHSGLFLVLLLKEPEKYLNFLNSSYHQYDVHKFMSKDLLLFMNKFINENKEEFVIHYMDSLKNEKVFESSRETLKRMSKSLLVEFSLIHNIYQEGSNSLKFFIHHNYSQLVTNKSDFRCEANVEIRKFVNSNNNYDLNMFEKNRMIKEIRSIMKNKSNSYLVKGNDVNNLNINFKDYDKLPKEIKDIYNDVKNNYKELMDRKELLDQESLIFINKLVEEKLEIIIKNYIYSERIKEADDKKDIQDLCIESISSINEVIVNKSKVIQESILDQMNAIKGYIKFDR